ncbi:MAG: radical SAM protein [Desulfomonile tiedjei]|nr:radical SAM protein [Desulfomonile tiedjei]
MDPLKTVNLTGLEKLIWDLRISIRTLWMVLNSENRAKRTENGVTAGDVLFNFRKLVSLQRTLLWRRYMVRFGDRVVMDSTFPPFPSRAFDRRVSNYLNTLDLVDTPSGIVSISTTNCCPYSCAFCSTNARHNLDTDLDEDLLKKTIRQVEALGVPSIILHGGEPMYRYDRFLRLVKHVNDDTCLWMFTTGYGVTPERAAELHDNGLFGVWVSLDHYNPQVHDRLRGHPGAFENARAAVESFRKAGVYTCLSLVPPQDLLDVENFKKYYDLAKELGVAEIRVLEVKPTGRQACQGVTPHSPVLEQAQKDLFHDPAYKDYPPLSGLSTWLEKDRALGCQCRFEYLFITSTGEVQPCEAAEISFGNICDEDFVDIYRRACAACRQPATGCIPMVMYPEVRNYQKVRDQMTSAEKGELATQIMCGFQEKGDIPGAYVPIWSAYRRRLEMYRKRKKLGN